MKKSFRIAYIICASILILLATGIGLVFSLTDFFNFASGDVANLVIYIISKVLVGVALIVVVILHCLNKRTQGVMMVDLIATLLMQFVPLAIRGFGQIAVHVNGGLAWSWILSLGLLVISSAIYLVILVLLSLSTKRFKETAKAVVMEDSPIKGKNSSLDESGNFKGPQK